MGWNHLLNIGNYYRLSNDVMKRMNISPVEKIDGHDEIWSFVILDRHKEIQENMRYLISTYGRVYDLELECILTQKSMAKSSNGYYYKAVYLVDPDPNAIKKYPLYLCHRLVALAFIPLVEGKPFVNHIDACPEHNYVWNLEWCTASENFHHAVKMGLINQPKGENRSNALWADEEIHFICSLMEEGHKATYIYHILGDIFKDERVTYERVRTLCKHIKHQTHWTHISKDYDIDFSKFNYAKEQASTKAAWERKQKQLLSYAKKLDPEELKLP